MKDFINKIATGDARELTKLIPDESIDLIFTDPIYNRIDDYEWLGKEASRILKPHGDLLVHFANIHLVEVAKTLDKNLDFRYLLNEKKMSSGSLLFSLNLFSHLIPVLWFTKGKPRKVKGRIDFIFGRPSGKHINHKWAKNISGSMRWLSRFSLQDDLILDPFCGGGSIPAVCKMLGRDYIAFEIDPEVAALARERVLNTQPPLFVLEPEQLGLES